jgi:probable phosphoglycerate mutase
VNKPEVWLVRHGETDWSAAGKHTGTTDVRLNDTGRAAARTLRELLAGERFELVLSSPLERALETCRLAGFGDEAVVDRDLREWDYGEYEGLTTPEIRETQPGWTVFDAQSPGGETVAEVADRADRVIARVLEVDGRVLLFGHGHSLRVLAARWLEADPTLGQRLLLSTATVSTLGWEREVRAIARWNAT